MGIISLIYLHQKKIIYINKIDYVRCKSYKVLSKAIINLLDYFRRTYHVNNFCISVKKNNSNKENFFKKIGFKKNVNKVSTYKSINYFYWHGENKK